MDDMTPFSDTSTAVVRQGFSWRTVMIAGTIMLLGGGAIGAWLVNHYALSAPAAPVAATVPASVVPVQRPLAAATAPAPVAISAPLTATQEATLATRISLLEDRLARISVSADGASGNAAKAEAMLLALAARRTLDRGLPLGVLEAQLRLRFGETQPADTA
jgi:hypothetical protein